MYDYDVARDPYILVKGSHKVITGEGLGPGVVFSIPWSTKVIETSEAVASVSVVDKRIRDRQELNIIHEKPFQKKTNIY